MNRYKLVIEYDGSAFSGFQVQPERRTIQGEIEKVLEFLLKTKTKIYASGRTDAGVSALGQVAHFDTEQELDRTFQASVNALLPNDIAVVDFSKVDESFDARFSVKRKTDFVRTIYDAKIVDIGNGIYAFEITGNGFLYNMVRIIFGTILKVGYKKLEPQDVTKIITQKSRSTAGGTMPAYPLLLKNVDYDTQK